MPLHRGTPILSAFASNPSLYADALEHQATPTSSTRTNNHPTRSRLKQALTSIISTLKRIVQHIADNNSECHSDERDGPIDGPIEDDPVFEMVRCLAELRRREEVSWYLAELQRKEEDVVRRKEGERGTWVDEDVPFVALGDMRDDDR